MFPVRVVVWAEEIEGGHGVDGSRHDLGPFHSNTLGTHQLASRPAVLAESVVEIADPGGPIGRAGFPLLFGLAVTSKAECLVEHLQDAPIGELWVPTGPGVSTNLCEPQCAQTGWVSSSAGR